MALGNLVNPPIQVPQIEEICGYHDLDDDQNGFFIKTLVPCEKELKKLGIKTQKDIEYAKFFVGFLRSLGAKFASRGKKNWWHPFYAKFLKKKCRNYKRVNSILENAGVLTECLTSNQNLS